MRLRDRAFLSCSFPSAPVMPKDKSTSEKIRKQPRVVVNAKETTLPPQLCPWHGVFIGESLSWMRMKTMACTTQMMLVRFIWIQYTLPVPLAQPNSPIVLRNQVGWWVIGRVLVDCDFTWFQHVTLCAKYKRCLFKVFHLFTWCSHERIPRVAGGKQKFVVVGWLTTVLIY